MGRPARTATQLPCLTIALALALAGCKDGCDAGGTPGVPSPSASPGKARVPPASDPENKDLVEGAIVAAKEPDGRVRLLKVIRVQAMPAALGTEFRMTAYDAVGKDFEEVARLYEKGGHKPVYRNILVRLVDFKKRDYRVIASEPVTDAERQSAR